MPFLPPNQQRQSTEGTEFMPKMHQNMIGGWALLGRAGRAYVVPQALYLYCTGDLLLMGWRGKGYFSGRGKGGESARKRKGREFPPTVNLSRVKHCTTLHSTQVRSRPTPVLSTSLSTSTRLTAQQTDNSLHEHITRYRTTTN